MNMTKTSFLLVLLLMLVFHGNAQPKSSRDFGRNGIEGFYLGGVISTNGWGAELKHMASRSFTVKAGLETLNLSYSYNFDENEMDYNADFDYKTGGIFILGDFNFTKNL